MGIGAAGLALAAILCTPRVAQADDLEKAGDINHKYTLHGLGLSFAYQW